MSFKIQFIYFFVYFSLINLIFMSNLKINTLIVLYYFKRKEMILKYLIKEKVIKNQLSKYF